MKQNIEGGYIGNIKITNLNKKTKIISNSFTNGFYKISNLDEYNILVEISGLDKSINETLMFFEDSNGYTSSNIFGRIDRIFFNQNNTLIHTWSTSTSTSINTNTNTNANSLNSDKIISNGYVQLEKSCVKCKN
jgi:hypothetical protein